MGDESKEQLTNPFSKHKDLFLEAGYTTYREAEPCVQGCKLTENDLQVEQGFSSIS